MASPYWFDSIINDYRFKIAGWVLSFVIAVVFFVLETSERRVSYEIEKEPTRIYDSENSTANIKIYEGDSLPIHEDVYVVTGMIWNSGDESIEKSFLRAPITLNLSARSRIIDYQIIARPENDSSKFVLVRVDPNTLKFDWRYFDEGDGIKFQIIYTGTSETFLYIDGKIAGCNIHRRLPMNPWKRILIAIGYILVFPCLIFWGFKQFFKKWGRRRKWYEAIGFILAILFCLFFFIAGLYGAYDTYVGGFTPTLEEVQRFSVANGGGGGW